MNKVAIYTRVSTTYQVDKDSLPLQRQDLINYSEYILGTKEYEVTDMTEISETDWSKLSNTNENMLTLITCVKGKSALRLCVQALEVN